MLEGVNMGISASTLERSSVGKEKNNNGRTENIRIVRRSVRTAALVPQPVGAS